METEKGKPTNAFETDKTVDETLQYILFVTKRMIDKASICAKNKTLTLEDSRFILASLSYALGSARGLLTLCEDVDRLVSNEMRGITESEKGYANEEK